MDILSFLLALSEDFTWNKSAIVQKFLRVKKISGSSKHTTWHDDSLSD
jgi:hypothetical protein